MALKESFLNNAEFPPAGFCFVLMTPALCSKEAYSLLCSRKLVLVVNNNNLHFFFFLRIV